MCVRFIYPYRLSSFNQFPFRCRPKIYLPSLLHNAYGVGSFVVESIYVYLCVAAFAVHEVKYPFRVHATKDNLRIRQKKNTFNSEH